MRPPVTVKTFMRATIWFCLVCPRFGLAQEPSEPIEAEAPEVLPGDPAEDDLPPGVITPWGRFGEDYAEGLMDVLLPLYFEDNLLLFANIRGAYSDVSEQELNLGLGARKRLGDTNTLLGLNVFYDSRWTENDSQFNQFGVGGELLSTWIDARANGYFPEDKREHLHTVEDTRLTGTSTTRSYSGHGAGNTIFETERTRTVASYIRNSFDVYDVPLEGYDMEIGLNIPLSIDWLEARLFGGYYAFEPVWSGNLDGDNDIEGFKGRLEFRIHDRIFLDAEVFEDDRLFGTDYLISARVGLPFDIGAISRGENPFAFTPAPEPAATPRFTEMVMRDPHIQIRNETELSTETFQETSVRNRTYPVLHDVIFVDGDNVGDPAENGTAENPFDVIQEGVDTSADSGRPNVFVHHADTPYMESVRVTESINLYGGAARFGNGTTPGNGLAPELRPTGFSPFIVEFDGADQVLFTGFTLDGTPVGPPVPLLGGVLFSDVGQAVARENTFRNLPIGAAGLFSASAPGFQLEVADNTFENTGVAVGGILGASGSMTIVDNTINDAILGVGVLGLNTSDRPETLIAGNTITSDMPVDPLSFPFVADTLDGFLPIPLPEELPLPMIGGVVVGAVNGKLAADIHDNQVTHPLLGITALSLNLYAPRSDLDLAVTGNKVSGGGLAETVDLLGDLLPLLPDDVLPLPGDLLPLPGDLPTLPPGGPTLPFDAGLAGIAAVSIGNNARLNDAVIQGNEVENTLLGITVAAAMDGKAKNVIISDNTLTDNGLGITGIGIAGGNLNGLTVTDNVVDGGGVPKLIPVIEQFTGPIPVEVPDFSFAGITLLGWNTNGMRDILISGNTVTDHALGVTALGIDSNLKRLEIVDNVLENNFAGILALGAGADANLSDLLIDGNLVSGAGSAFVADLIGLFLDEDIAFPDVGLAGVGVIGLNQAKINDFTVSDNVVSDQLLGVVALGFGDAAMKRGRIGGNTLEYGLGGIAAASLFDANMNDLMILDNDLTGVGVNLGAGLPLGPVTLFNDKALGGIGVIAFNAKAKDAVIEDNTVRNNEYGISIVEVGGGKTNGWMESGNTHEDNTTDLFLYPFSP